MCEDDAFSPDWDAMEDADQLGSPVWRTNDPIVPIWAPGQQPQPRQNLKPLLLAYKQCVLEQQQLQQQQQQQQSQPQPPPPLQQQQPKGESGGQPPAGPPRHRGQRGGKRHYKQRKAAIAVVRVGNLLRVGNYRHRAPDVILLALLGLQGAGWQKQCAELRVAWLCQGRGRYALCSLVRRCVIPGSPPPPPTAQAMKATSAIKATSARGRCAFCPLVRRGVLVCGVLRCCCKVVSWTGVMGLRRAAYGVQLSWAYAPGELPGNFAEQQLLV